MNFFDLILDSDYCANTCFCCHIDRAKKNKEIFAIAAAKEVGFFSDPTTQISA